MSPQKISELGSTMKKNFEKVEEEASIRKRKSRYMRPAIKFHGPNNVWVLCRPTFMSSDIPRKLYQKKIFIVILG